MSANLRKRPRHPLDMRAYIETPTAVSVADVSETGAKLVVKDPASVPDEFLLRLRPDLRKWCRVVWRGAEEVGIEFIAPPDLKN
ncbi:PilZ domain-containing protein [Rhodoplanes sp. Z2-YC6860]|uniref:PilZ domain-containing protein n=1 Tax=Rhodoplanes sp. Z2-YC6860 TaxID=674703 RepID=UPI00082D8338|nr:PilZ domain-containing protein [Rhodoplanes sp. Z2-YC6860]